MLRTWNRKLGLLLVAIVTVYGAANFRVADAKHEVWAENNANRASMVKDKGVARTSFPTEFKLFDLDLDALHQQLFSIVGNDARQSSTVISLPNADGNIEQFEVYEASNFEPDLQAQFPEIRAFSGKGITDRFATLKLSISPQGIQTMIFRTNTDNEFIEPYSDDHATYAVFSTHREKGSLPWECSTEDRKLVADTSSKLAESAQPESNAGQIKTMRLAQSCNGEYSNFFGATSAAQVALVLAAFNNTLTRANGTYEKDLAIHLNLIANTTAVIYYDPLTDPYTTLGAWNGQLQSTLTANIGEANYDIGHMFGASGGGGNAGCIGCVCVDGQKGSGITSPADGIPMGDNFDIDFVVHEVGHQMGANHTFSFQNEGSGVQKEVGSGITIMGYAGITSQDVAPHSIDTFHEASISQIQVNMATKVCPITTTMTANHAPVVAGVSNFTIPISTPFALTGSATDAESDPLTYQWEQDDNSTTTGNASVASPTKATGPNWLSFVPTASGTRTFPRLSTIQAGLFVTPTLPGGDAVANIEALSSISRSLNFRLTVRDNRPYVAGSTIGQTQFTNMTITVSNTSGPFKVTAPNTAVSYVGGSTQTVTWDVAGTTGAPVSAANVKISLSTDSGATFPTVISASTPNDGTESVTIPNSPTGTARIKVEAVGNIFFDMSDANFTITPGAGVTQKAPLDFDGDGKTDYSVVRTAGGLNTWYTLPSSGGFTSTGWGSTGDVLVPGDYDGDNKWDVAVWRPGTPANFYILRSATNTLQITAFGQSGDDPRITQDYDGDGKADPSVTRNVGGVLSYYLLRSTLGFTGVSFGNGVTDIGVRGDFDGDGKADIACYRTNMGAPANTFFVIRSSTGVVVGQNWGVFTSDNIVPGDFDGDGKTDFAVWRGVSGGGNGGWYWIRSSDGAVNAVGFGVAGTDRPVPGDYDGDGKTDPAVWRPGTPAVFYTLRSTAGFGAVNFGTTGDVAPANSLQAR
ncbi:MAG: reprolysin-like metallopeptidase [Pyrinomonadaceae bacterium]